MKHDGAITQCKREEGLKNLQEYLNLQEYQTILELDLSTPKLEAILAFRKSDKNYDILTFARKRTEGLDGSE